MSMPRHWAACRAVTGVRLSERDFDVRLSEGDFDVRLSERDFDFLQQQRQAGGLADFLTRSIKNWGGETPFCLAHAIFCVSLMQQHRSQQTAALTHPHGQSMHG